MPDTLARLFRVTRRPARASALASAPKKLWIVKASHRLPNALSLWERVGVRD